VSAIHATIGSANQVLSARVQMTSTKLAAAAAVYSSQDADSAAGVRATIYEV
jgi:hypothetical protein